MQGIVQNIYHKKNNCSRVIASSCFLYTLNIFFLLNILQDVSRERHKNKMPFNEGHGCSTFNSKLNSFIFKTWKNASK